MLNMDVYDQSAHQVPVDHAAETLFYLANEIDKLYDISEPPEVKPTDIPDGGAPRR
jgi:hypothetical protein